MGSEDGTQDVVLCFGSCFHAFSQGATPSQVHNPPPPLHTEPSPHLPTPLLPILVFPLFFMGAPQKAPDFFFQEEVWSLLTHVTGLKHAPVHHVRWLQRISLRERRFLHKNMKEPTPNMSAGTTGCSGCFWFLLSINIKSLMVIKTPCSMPTSLP